MSLLEKLNIDLLVPLLIVFGLLRFKKNFCYPQKLLSGLKFFVSNTVLSQKNLRIQPSDDNKQQETSIIDKKLKEFNVSMIELDGSFRKGSLLSSVLLYDVYDHLIFLSLSSFAVHTFSTLFHCAKPSSAYSIWGSLLVALSTVYPFRSLIRVLIMTGFKAFESRLALLVGAVSLVGMAILLFTPVDFTGLSLNDTLWSTAIHCNALLLQLSTTAVQPQIPVMVAIIKLLLSLLTAVAAASMVIPAIRFSQSFVTLQIGAAHERASKHMRYILAIDLLFPILVAATMIPYSPYSVVRVAEWERDDGNWLALQLLAVLTMVSIRLFCMRRHLQSFMDASVKSISVEIALNDNADAKGIQDKVAARVNYIPAAAVQYVSIPLCALGLAMMIHKSTPVGTGLCVDLRSVIGMDILEMTSVSASALSFDATSAALAIHNSGSPSLASALHLFLMSAGEGGVSPSEKLRAFLVKLMSSLHLLPVGAFLSLGRAALCVHCLLWFFLSCGASLYWFFSPASLKKHNGGLLLKKEQ